MQLIFEKKDTDIIEVYLVDEGQKTQFDYGNMILDIYEDGIIEDAKLEGDFTEIEKQSINELVQDMRRAVDEANSQAESDEDELDS
ncbi:MAG: hypothetical protein ACI4LZ_04395 [Anaerovoracaceae bacterium]